MNHSLTLRKHETIPGDLIPEIARKCIHALIALVPAMASFNLSYTALLLMGGTLFYTFAESLRFLGFAPPLVSSITTAVLRRREKDRFVLGPITLGLGALLALILFPPSVAALAVYILAFADSAASLVGMFLGRLRPAIMGGKSIEGSAACFAAAFLIGFLVYSDYRIALAAGLASVIVDFLPLGDFDNIILPLAAGFSVMIVRL